MSCAKRKQIIRFEQSKQHITKYFARKGEARKYELDNRKSIVDQTRSDKIKLV